MREKGVVKIRMHIVAITHADFEPVGAIADWAEERGFSLDIRAPYRGEPLPSVEECDFLMIMGGPQNGCEAGLYSYLQQEVALIRSAIEEERFVLGVCLGAQLMGLALGAKVKKSPHPEFGFFSVELTAEGENDPVVSALPEKFEAFHWHQDMPGLPKGASCLARSEGCPHQAVRFTPRAYGLQFHLEPRRPEAVKLIENCPLPQGRYSQSAKVMLSQDFGMLNRYLELFLDRLVMT
jgi:GMP synthase (glutamine-hydrolysing)